MKLKSLVASVALAAASFAASAATTTPLFVNGTSFHDVSLGSITVAGPSTVTGALGFADSMTFPFGVISLDSVDFSGGALGSYSFSGPSFSFSPVAAGSYELKVSGSILDTSPQFSGALIAATYNIAAVPEPESYAMLLAGLGLMAGIARRRSAQA